MLVILTVLLARLAGLASACPSPPDADSPRAAVCRLSSAPPLVDVVVYRPPRGSVVAAAVISLTGRGCCCCAPEDCRPVTALRLRPNPRGSVCDRSDGSCPPRAAAAYLAVVFRRYTLPHHIDTNTHIRTDLLQHCSDTKSGQILDTRRTLLR